MSSDIIIAMFRMNCNTAAWEEYIGIQTCYISKLLIFINIMERECIFGLFILSMVNTVQ